MNVHSQILNRVKDEHFHPVLSNGQQIAIEVLDLLTTRRYLSPDFEELCLLLKKPHLQVSLSDTLLIFIVYIFNIPMTTKFFASSSSYMQRLLDAHDAVAQKDYNPRLSELPQDIDKDEETIKIAQLVKSDEPLVSFLI